MGGFFIALTGELVVSEYTPYEPVQPPPGDRKTGLWVAVIGAAACLIVAIIALSFAGLGWIAYTREQDENATATKQAQNDGATATARAHIIAPPSGWALKMDEQFTSNYNNWYTGPFEDDLGIVEFAIEDEAYQWLVEGNFERGIGWEEFPGFGRGEGDFYVSVDCLQTSGDAINSYYGLLFRYLDGDNYFRYAVSDAGYMHIGLRKEDHLSDLLPWKPIDLIDTGEVNQIAALAVGAHYTFFINGEFVYELDDDRLSGGVIGLLAGVTDVNRSEFQFDNFQVYGP